MKKLYILSIFCFIAVLTYAQPVNYTVTVTQVQWFEGGFGGPCYEFGTEEYTALVWFDDNLNGTNVGGNCFTCNNNGNCTISPNTTLGGRNNTCAETINIVFEAWENDSNPRCTENGGDDCECGPSTVAAIPFQNSGPGCTTYGNFGCSGNHNVQVEICWDYVTPPPANDDCAGAIAVGAGSTPFTLLEECSGPDITSCSTNDYNDIWYEYTVGNCHLEQLIIDTEGSSFDTALSIWDACGGNEIDCDDDGGTGLLSNISINDCIDPGTTYYIRVSGWNGSDGTGVLNITETLDTTAPTFTNCPTQADLPADANCMAAVPDFTTTATATDNCDNSVSITQSPAAGTMVGLGAQTVTLTATDDCTNSTSTCTVTFNVVDNTAPVCVAQNVTVNIDAAGNASVTIAQIDGGSSDNCAVTSTTISAGQTAYTCDDVGSSFTVTLQVMDAAGNTSTCDATVTVADPSSNCCAAPMAVCQAFTAQLDATGNIAIVAADVDGGSTAECGLASLTIDNADFDCTNIGTNNVTLTITDINGDSDQCTAVVTVEDNVFPTATAPAPINVECPADVPAADPAVVTDEADNCSATVTLASEMSDGNTCPETITRTYSVTDPSGNAIEVTQLVVIEDVTPPVAPTPPADISEQCAADIPAAVDLTAVDNCDGDITVSPTEVNTPGTCPSSFTLVRTWTFTDECGNESEVSQTITVDDDTPPVPPTPPADITEQCAADIPAAVDLTAVDNCDGDITVSPTEVNTPGACPSSFTLVRTWTFTDECGNTSEVMQTITVNDDTAPVAPTPPADITEQCAADIPAAVDLTAVDNCDGDITVSPTEVNTPGACPSSFTLVRTWTFTDECGNESEVSQTISINDDTAPTPVCQDITVSLDANGQASITVADVDNGSTDNCTAAATDLDFELSQTTFDCTDAGQVVPVTMTVTDECGNAADCIANVTVNDSSAPSVATCPTNISVNNDAGTCEAVVNYDLPTFSDNCDGTNTGTLTAGLPPNSSFPVGVTTVTYEYTDAAGNTMATCSFEVEVVDNEAPTAVCQNLTLGLDENFELMITPEDIEAGSTDNCGVSDLILDMENFDCTNSGTNMMTLTVIDEAGNSSTCQAQVEVPATPEPMITCPETVRDCEGQFNLEFTDNNPFTFGIAQATISGTAAPFVLGDISPGGNATLNLGAATTGQPLTLTYTLTVGDCLPVSFSCTFTVATSCSDAGSFPRN